MNSDLVTILDGNTFVVSDSRGDIEASLTDPTGLFSFDTRFLSTWVMRVDGERLNPLSVDDLQYFETRFFLVPGTGTVYVDAKLSVIRRRAVGDGFHEELTILNHDEDPVELTVRVDAGCDFADLFEVKDALAKKGRYYARVEKGRLLLGYERDTFGRVTAISASAPARLDDHGLTFAVNIERVWQRISPDLTEGTEPRAPGFGTITALGTTTADPNLVYAGTDSGLVWVSRNAMAEPSEVTWQKLESPVFPGRWVTRITVDPDNPNVAWASFSGWRSGDSYPHLVMTSDGGNTWVDIVGKRVPQAPINDVVRHPSHKRWLFIATDVGVFRTTNLGDTWIKVGENLPLVPINDIDLPAGSDTLYAATYGRSVWTTSLADAS